MNLKKVFFTLVIIGFCKSVNAQKKILKEYPVIGKKCPDFTFNEVHYYSKSSVTLSDFQGKWLILDFWDSHCGACVRSFPMTDKLQKKFKDQIRFLLVGQSDFEWNRDIRRLFEKYRKTENLNLSIAYDSTLSNRFGSWANPYILIIDPKGIVRVITNSMDEENINLLLKGGNAQFVPVVSVDKQEEKRNRFSIYKPYLISNNGTADTNFLFRSLLAKFNIDSMPFLFTAIPNYIQNAKGLFQIAGTSRMWLYNLAYLGKNFINLEDAEYNEYSMYPLLKIKNNEIAKQFYFGDHARKEGLYIYSTSFPPEMTSEEYIREIIKSDLKKYFGYKVTIEQRMRPVWNLVTIPGKIELHKTKGGKENNFISLGRDGIVATNITSKKILSIIESYNKQRTFNDEAFFDQTNLGYNLDVRLDAAMANFEDLVKALRENGLDLVKGERLMKVLVIEDPN